LSLDLATALRAETPVAPGELRKRVALMAATTPPRRRGIPRRWLLLAAPAAAAASVGVAVVVGLMSSSTPPAQVAQPPTPAEVMELAPTPKAPAARARARPRALAPVTSAGSKQEFRAAAPAPSTTRAQNVNATLRLLVDDTNDLSGTTQRALRTTRRLGGYVVAVDYGTPNTSEGTASLRLRIPVSRLQAAIVRFSGMGRILAQQTQITDVQQRLDDLTRQIRRAKGNKTKIAALRRERTRISRRAAYATVGLDLTTHEPEQKAAPPSRLHRTISNATGVLTTELAVGAYALIVAGPLLILLAAAFAGSRAYRRYADQRLLERA
jgi:negative regulator of sigma E activity